MVLWNSNISVKRWIGVNVKLVYNRILIDICWSIYVDIIDVAAGRPAVSDDPSDDMFIHCALEAGIQNIISGDKHLLKLKTYQQIGIFTVTEFLKKMDKIHGEDVDWFD